MHASLNIALNDLRIFFAERGNLVGLIVLPVAFTLLLGWVFNGGNSVPSRVRVDIIDEDGTAQSAQLLDQIRATNDTLVLCPMDNDEDDYCQLEGTQLTLDEAIDRAQNEFSEALIVIPAGYGEALSNFGEVEIDFYAVGNVTIPNAVEQTVNAVLQEINSASLTAATAGALIDALGEQTGLGPLLVGVRAPLVAGTYSEVEQRLAGRAEAVRYVLTTGDEDETVDQAFGQSVPGMGSLYVMFTVLGGISALLRERKQWTLQRLAALPVSRAQILGGKVLTYFTLGMIQFLVVFSVAFIVKLDLGDQPLVLFPIMAAFALCCTGMTFAIAPRIESEGQAQGLTNLLSLTLAPLGGAWWPLEIVPDFMRTVAYLSPVAWAMQAFHDVMWYNGGLAEVLPEVGVLLGAAVVLFVLGIGRFRTT